MAYLQLGLRTLYRDWRMEFAIEKSWNETGGIASASNRQVPVRHTANQKKKFIQMESV